MKKQLINTLLFTISCIASINAQDQIENGDFENWENIGSSNEEPIDWSSVKTSDNAFLSNTAPQVIFRDNDAHSGSYSLKLENKTIFGVVANGIATTGRVHAETNPNNAYVFTDQNNTDYNQNFSSKPDSLTGWFKYLPQANDKGDIQVLIHNGYTEIPTNDQSNWIAIAKKEFTGNTSNWTRFSTPFNYLNNNTPSFMISVVSAGDSTIAIAGSELFIDDLSLVYNSPTNDKLNDSPNMNLWYHNQSLHIEKLNTNNEYFLTVYDLSGKSVFKKQILFGEVNILLPQINSGIYIAELENLNNKEKTIIKIKR